jgi:tRNA pseudouridine38-40 synthase
VNKFFYLITIQYCGFRFSGWQKQINGKTIQEMVDRTINFITEHDNFKTLGAGRTDAKVSANEYLLELFIEDQQNEKKLLESLNKYLPPDIRALGVVEVDESFNILQVPKIKEYIYLFTTKTKPHPFSAPYMVFFDQEIDIEKMKKAATVFEGHHNFLHYCYKPSEHTEICREIISCEIVENDLYTASFFPDKSWMLKVRGHGFLRHQIRLIMGTLINLGKGKMSLSDLSKSLEGEYLPGLGVIAPSSGLILHKIER